MDGAMRPVAVGAESGARPAAGWTSPSAAGGPGGAISPWIRDRPEQMGANPIQTAVRKAAF